MEGADGEAEATDNPGKPIRNSCPRQAGERCRDCGATFTKMISPEMLHGPPCREIMIDQEEEETGLVFSDEDEDSPLYGVLPPLADRGTQRWPDFQHGEQ